MTTPTKHHKSMRTAFIRIFSRNVDKNSDVHSYTFDDILSTLESWAKSLSFKYWAIKHENDGNDEDKRVHYHIVIKFKNPVPFHLLKNKFPYGDIESARSVKSCIQYLVHYNDIGKKSYKLSDIRTNSEETLQQYFDGSGRGIDYYIDQIIKGNIKEYNQYETIPAHLWVGNRTKIENAHIFFKEKLYQDKDRMINNEFIYGLTGTGKTNWVKAYCRIKGLSLCISSSSNDPFQDYKGEDVLLLDDLRDDCFVFADLLKILDNHTKSTSKSRYHNKFFLGKKIVIASTLPLDSWYPFESAESRLQLYRRIGNKYNFTRDHIQQFAYNPNTYKYEFVKQFENPIKNKYSDTTIEDIVSDVGLTESKAQALDGDYSSILTGDLDTPNLFQ